MSIQDWGGRHDDLEPYYDRFEFLAGISGKAGNIKGVIQAGGNPFEVTAQENNILPPMKEILAPTLFNGGRSFDWLSHPFPSPSANLSTDYTNPLGVRVA